MTTRRILASTSMAALLAISGLGLPAMAEAGNRHHEERYSQSDGRYDRHYSGRHHHDRGRWKHRHSHRQHRDHYVYRDVVRYWPLDHSGLRLIIHFDD